MSHKPNIIKYPLQPEEVPADAADRARRVERRRDILEAMKEVERASIEAAARKMAAVDGDPDQMVLVGISRRHSTPGIVRTPRGDLHRAEEWEARPLWTLYADYAEASK